MYPKLHDAIVLVLLDVSDGAGNTQWIADQIVHRNLYHGKGTSPVNADAIRLQAIDPRRAHLFQMPSQNTVKLRIESP